MARPTVFTKQILQKLEEAFSLDCTDKEACIYADIAPSSLYNYQAEHPEFLERKELLKMRPVLAARKTVVERIKKDPNMALRYLERKLKGEFSPRIEVEKYKVEGAIKLPRITEDKYKRMVERELVRLNKGQTP